MSITKTITEAKPMKKAGVPRHPDFMPPHPGEYIREDVLPGLNITKSDFAAALGISRQMLHGILSEKHPLTVEMAVRLGHVLGNGPDIWVKLQQAHDLWHARRKVDVTKLKRVTTDTAHAA
jgi:addiction module HigA family antidote